MSRNKNAQKVRTEKMETQVVNKTWNMILKKVQKILMTMMFI
jgi:hypothetical protein